MLSTSSKIVPLPLDKTAVFYTPMEGDDIYVRTGVSKKDSLYHSILKSIKSAKEYASKSEKERKKSVEKIKRKIIPEKDFNKQLFIKNFSDIYTTKTIENKLLDDTEKKVIKVLSDIVPIDTLNPIIQKNDEKTLLTEIESVMIKQLKSASPDAKKVEYCIKILKAVIQKLLDASITEKPLTIETVASSIHREIFVINSKNRLPFEYKKNKRKKMIILLYLEDEKIYEPIGKLLHGNYIQREFEMKDSIIRKINTYLYHKDLLEERYPELYEYIEKQNKEQHSKSSTSSKSSNNKNSKSDNSNNSKSNKSDNSNNSKNSKTSKSNNSNNSNSSDS